MVNVNWRTMEWTGTSVLQGYVKVLVSLFVFLVLYVCWCTMMMGLWLLWFLLCGWVLGCGSVMVPRTLDS